MSEKNILQNLGWMASLTRKYGVPRGFDRVIDRLVPPGSRLGSQDVTFGLDDGLRVKADLDSYLDRRLYWHGYYSNKYIEQFVEDVAREGNVAIDCGANIGIYALRLSRSVGSAGKVIAIEPHDPVRRRLEANVLLNGFQDRVAVMSCALSGNRGKTVFHYPPPGDANQGNASLYGKGSDWLEKEVETRTLDDIADEHDLSRLDIIRCDVQGAEFDALRGGKKMIRMHKPIISIRCNQELLSAANMKISELVAYLHGLGYEAYIHVRKKLVRYAESMPLKDAEFLFLYDAGRYGEFRSA